MAPTLETAVSFVSKPAPAAARPPPAGSELRRKENLPLLSVVKSERVRAPRGAADGPAAGVRRGLSVMGPATIWRIVHPGCFESRTLMPGSAQ